MCIRDIIAMQEKVQSASRISPYCSDAFVTTCFISRISLPYVRCNLVQPAHNPDRPTRDSELSWCGLCRPSTLRRLSALFTMEHEKVTGYVWQQQSAGQYDRYNAGECVLGDGLVLCGECHRGYEYVWWFGEDGIQPHVKLFASLRIVYQPDDLSQCGPDEAQVAGSDRKGFPYFGLHGLLFFVL